MRALWMTILSWMITFASLIVLIVYVLILYKLLYIPSSFLLLSLFFFPVFVMILSLYKLKSENGSFRTLYLLITLVIILTIIIDSMLLFIFKIEDAINFQYIANIEITILLGLVLLGKEQFRRVISWKKSYYGRYILFLVSTLISVYCFWNILVNYYYRFNKPINYQLLTLFSLLILLLYIPFLFFAFMIIKSPIDQSSV